MVGYLHSMVGNSSLIVKFKLKPITIHIVIKMEEVYFGLL